MFATQYHVETILLKKSKHAGIPLNRIKEDELIGIGAKRSAK